MKIRNILYAIIAMVTIAMTGCDKMPDNGKLDGMWQLMSVERQGIVEDLKPTKHYWSIRYNLVQLNKEYSSDMYAHFERKGDQLLVYDLCYFSRNATEADDNEWIPEEKAADLAPWGIYPVADTARPSRLCQTFRIEVLDSSSMILSSDGCKLLFRRF